jgi:uncharacterized membrane protein
MQKFSKFKEIPTVFPVILIVIALLGFMDAGYLTVEHYMNTIPPCAVGNCEVVLTSEYSTLYGIPLALLGALYYLSILVLLVAYIDTKKHIVLSLAMSLSCIGLLVSLWLLYLQGFVLNAFCQYCVVSATTSILLFAISLYTYIKYRIKSE